MPALLSRAQPAQHFGPDSLIIRRLCWGLAGAVTVGGALTFLLPDTLRGTAAMNGSARGTALTMVVLGVPTLIVTTLLRLGKPVTSARAALVRIGAVAFLVYNSILLLFATPFNEWFLIYVVMLQLALATLVLLGRQSESLPLGRRFGSGRWARVIAGYLFVVVVANTLLWLSAVVPALGHADDPAFLVGTGLITNPIYVQDLAFWLPLAGLSAWWLWHRRRRGVVLVGGFLSMWVLEGVCVAMDQWFGSQADPHSSVVSSSMVLPFLILALVSAAALTALLRPLPGPGEHDEHVGSPHRRRL